MDALREGHKRSIPAGPLFAAAAAVVVVSRGARPAESGRRPFPEPQIDFFVDVKRFPIAPDDEDG